MPVIVQNRSSTIITKHTLICHRASCSRGDYFLFGSVFIKKNNKTGFFYKKPKPNQNQFKPTGFGSVILGQKPVQTDQFQFGSVILY